MGISIYRINYGMISVFLCFFFKSKSKTRAYDGSTVKRETRAGFNVQIYFGWLVGF